jgi:ATP-dependent RNA helicase DeaD
VGDGDEREIAAPPPQNGRVPRRGAPPERPAESGFARLFIGAGRTAGIRPADLVGAIAGEANVPSKAIGAIRSRRTFRVVEVPEELADGIIASMRGRRACAARR